MTNQVPGYQKCWHGNQQSMTVGIISGVGISRVCVRHLLRRFSLCLFLSVCMTWHVVYIKYTYKHASLVNLSSTFVLISFSLFQGKNRYVMFCILCVACFYYELVVKQVKANHDTLAITDRCPIKIIIKLIMNKLSAGSRSCCLFLDFYCSEKVCCIPYHVIVKQMLL